MHGAYNVKYSALFTGIFSYIRFVNWCLMMAFKRAETFLSKDKTLSKLVVTDGHFVLI